MRYLLACSIALAIAPPGRAQENEAEKLFRAMEKKIRTAKAFTVSATYSIGKRKSKADLLLTQDNKARLDVTGHFGRPAAGFEVVSDGKQSKSNGATLNVMPSGLPAIEAGGQSEWPTPKSFHASLCTTLCRGGMWYTVLTLPYARGGELGLDPDGAESKMKVYDFKLDGAEKVASRDAKVIRYRFGKGDGCRHDEEITLWIDAKTLLPLKRSFTLKIDMIPISETYDRFVLDPKIEARAFDLPK